MTTTTTTTSSATPARLAGPAPFHELEPLLAGRVHRPGSAPYDALCRPFNLTVAVHPEAVVAAADAHDVVEAVRFAGRHGLSVSAQATGHGTNGTTDGLLVHTGALAEVTVDPEARTARVGAGTRWRQVIDAAAEHGLAPLAGSSPDVGIVGYTLGGGFGPVARTYGIASDRVRAVEVVTGEGVLRRVTASEHPDLFWALRGGKGVLGIVTAIEFDLLPIRALYAGALWFDGADARQVLDLWRTWSAQLPLEATTSVQVANLPNLPGVPAPLAGRTTVSVRFAWAGDPEEGATVLAPLRAVATPVIDAVDVMPYTALGRIHSDPETPMPAATTHRLLHSFPAEAVTSLLRVVGPGTGSPLVSVEIRQLGGAVADRTAARGPADAPDSAVGHREAGFSLMAVGLATRDTAEATRDRAARLVEALAPWQHPGLLANFAHATPRSTSRDDLAQVFTAEALTRLADIARRHDPHGIIADAAPLRG